MLKPHNHTETEEEWDTEKQRGLLNIITDGGIIVEFRFKGFSLSTELEGSLVNYIPLVTEVLLNASYDTQKPIYTYLQCHLHL